MVLWTGQTDYTYVSAIIPVSRLIQFCFKRPRCLFLQLILVSRYTMQSRSIQVSYVVRQLLYLASETVVTPANLACLPLLKPLIKAVVEGRTNISSTQSRWFASRNAENDVEEMPLRLLTPQQRIRIRETIDGVIKYDESLESPHLPV